MCGIGGIYHLDAERPVEPERLAAMSRCLAHRGPDDDGVHLDRNVGLAHRRLSIIDLSPAGHQPMSEESGRYWIVYNGEIYNYLELRQQLMARGCRFRSHTDTEVILRLYEADGPDCLRRLNGMFAFAIWDARERTLFAARDRFGIKPFYYALPGRTFLFASEIKGLLASGLLPACMNGVGLADYLSFQTCLEDRTLFQGVAKLEPGQALRLSADGTLQKWRYWEPDFTPDTDHTEAYFEHQLLRLLEDAVRLQLRADVPVGAHLSGGLDSSTVVCLAASLLGTPLKTFTGAFREGPQFDETRYARAVSEHAGTDHHEVFITADDFVESMPRLVYAMDEPAAGPGLFPQYFVSRLAAPHVKVVLGGQGGDEIFGGYTRYLIAYLEACLKGGIDGTQDDRPYVVTFESILPNLGQLRGYEPLLRHFWREGLFEPADRRYLRLIDRSEGLRELLHPDALALDGYQPDETFRALFSEGDCHSLINQMTRFDLRALLPALLHVEDRTSMAVSLESRVPLLDHRIVELVAAMPPMVKFKGGRSKHVFREVVQHLIPPLIRDRTDKMGFPVPLDEWYRQGVVRDFVRDTLLGPRARARGLFQVERIAPLLEAEQRYGRRIWGLLSLELWMEAFLDGPAPAADATARGLLQTAE